MDTFASSSAYMSFESRKSIEEEIFEAIKDNLVYIIGVSGMAGVGKTTLVDKLVERVRNEKIFDYVVKTVVTQQVDLIKIQDNIAASLGMKLNEKGSLSDRALSLRTRLKRSDDRVLVILDDVWDMLDLDKDVGIPIRSQKGCKVLLTSRNVRVAFDHEAEREISLQVLSEEEGWDLFAKIAGKSIEEGLDGLRPIAEQVAKECKGLPIALVTVARALGNKPIIVWRNALRDLRNALPTNIPGMLSCVYRPLQLSYQHLESEEAKSLFLTCCLFREGSEIPIETLTRYGMGLQLFRGGESLEEASDKAITLVETLKDHFP